MTETQGQIIIGFLAGIMGLLSIIYFKLCEIYNSQRKKTKTKNSHE
ncbi:hypothetical protein [endosymbiont DhMRE of Dentiscutata heterogama]|nr:hypothetical protein [endosymbiont DhMRE of Dentiscutata heterogama]